MGGDPDAPTLLSGAALTAFKLNGQFLEVAEHLARPADITAAWWQVLGAVLRAPLPVAAIGREMGITRQSVQRIADLLVDRGLAEYRANPATGGPSWSPRPTRAGRRSPRSRPATPRSPVACRRRWGGRSWLRHWRP